MTQLSSRLTGLTGSGGDGWDVHRRAQDMQAAGLPVTDLTVGDHDVRTDPDIVAAMGRASSGANLGYPPMPGSPALRDAIAARVSARTGVPTTRDNVVITTGGQGALFAAHAAACDAGDEALFIDPYYATYPGTIRSVQAIPRAVPALPEDGFQPRPEAIAAAIGPRTRSLLINSPHNPTGVVYTAETMDGIARLCRDHDLWLISDEVYDTQVWEGTHISPRVLPGMADRTMVVGSMSKSHAMTGSRIGWIIASEDTAAHLINLSTHTTYGLPGYIQEAALFALSQGTAWEERVAAPYRRRRAMALELLANAPHIRHVPCDGAMYIMLDIRATGQTGIAFAEGLLDAEAIGVMPGESFGATAAGHIRVAMTVPEAALADALSRIIGFAERTAHAA